MGTPGPISIRKMAAGLEVSKSQVARDAQAGMPMTDVAAARAWRLANHDVSRTKDGRIDRPLAATSGPLQPELAAATNTSPRADAGLATGAGAEEFSAPASAEEQDEPVDEHTAAYREHRAAREKVNAQRGQLELDQLRGNLIGLDEAKRLAFTAFRTLRDAVLNVPARIKDQAAIETDPFKVEQLIEAELTAALAGFDPAAVTRDDADDDPD